MSSLFTVNKNCDTHTDTPAMADIRPKCNFMKSLLAVITPMQVIEHTATENELKRIQYFFVMSTNSPKRKKRNTAICMSIHAISSGSVVVEASLKLD